VALLATLAPQEAEGLVRGWRLWARPEQIAPPGDWLVWLILSGRGWGKTRTAAEWLREQVELRGRRRIALVARTAADVRDVVIEGESGLLAISPSWNKPLYEPSKRRLTWPNGAIATAYSADEPDLLRGPQHDAAAADELASWQYAQQTWDNLMLSLRLGDHPQVIVTTTPRPLKIIRQLMQSPSTVVTRGTTFDNAANLAPSALAEYRHRYEGTRLGRQELMGEVLDDNPGALWNRETLDRNRVRVAPDLVRVVVAIDPAVTVPVSDSIMSARARASSSRAGPTRNRCNTGLGFISRTQQSRTFCRRCACGHGPPHACPADWPGTRGFVLASGSKEVDCVP